MTTRSRMMRPGGVLSRAARRPFLTMAVFLAVLLIGGGALALATGYFDKESVTFVVRDKESVATDNSGHEYRVYTDQGTYVIKDSFIYTRFNSADVYGLLEPGQRYTCDAYGFRLPFFSTFKNLLDCRPA